MNRRGFFRTTFVAMLGAIGFAATKPSSAKSSSFRLDYRIYTAECEFVSEEAAWQWLGEQTPTIPSGMCLIDESRTLEVHKSIFIATYSWTAKR